MSVEFTTLVQIYYNDSNLMFQHIVKYHDFYISHISLQLQNYSYIYSSDLSPFSIDSDNYRIDFNSTAQYDRNCLIYIIDKQNSNAPITKLSASTDFIESIRDHILENRSLAINERQASYFEGLLPAIDNRRNYENDDNNAQQYQPNNGFEQYNINQMLNSGPPIGSTQYRNNVRVNNVRVNNENNPSNNTMDPEYIENAGSVHANNSNNPSEINQNGSGLRKTKKKQRKNKRKTRIRK
jgi:hypothetical protein